MIRLPFQVHGEFLLNSEAEMLYIEEAGMGPICSHLYELFKTIKTGRKYHIGMVVDRKQNYFILTFRSLEKNQLQFIWFFGLKKKIIDRRRY